jgi:phenylalanyl-tRNA synthetase beta chain
MLISLNWIRDFVDLPQDIDPRELAERLTRITAEVEGVEQIRVAAKGLVAARIEQVQPAADSGNLTKAVLSVGKGKTFETVSAATGLQVGRRVIYAPPGASVEKLGVVESATIGGSTSQGMILPGDALGVPMAIQDAIFLDPSVAPGQALPSDLFEDWVIEIDNKSITHRPDLWGHYGMAREIAAIVGLPLKPYPVEPYEGLARSDLPELPVRIDAPEGCRRWSGIALDGVPTQPAPLWMQLRLGHVGLRPISGLVDLTNYIMLDLGQPMHAFDASKVERIEVDWAHDGEKFKTLDGMDRTLSAQTLMIKSGGRSVAPAGIMGGLDTEVTDETVTLLLEAGNFDATTIRLAAAQMGLRTDASARFEKSLDPAHTVLSVQRFVHLARPEYPELKLVTRLSDAFPRPLPSVKIDVRLHEVSRTIGRRVSADEIVGALAPLGFEVRNGESSVTVAVPSFRATGDVAIEADVIEEIARRIGLDAVEPTMPRVSVRRFEPNALHHLEQETLRCFADAHAFHEIHGYSWYDAAWLSQIGVEPGCCIQLRNPASEGSSSMRRSLMPGMLAAVVKNRFHFSEMGLMELGSVFEPESMETRRVALCLAKRGKKLDEPLHESLKGALQSWSLETLQRPLWFDACEADPSSPWEHQFRTARVRVEGGELGRVSVVDLPLRRAMDEHLASWSVAWAEIRLDHLPALPAAQEVIGVIPEHPLVEMDFSFLVRKTLRYGAVRDHLGAFSHPLLKRVRYVAAYEGRSVADDHRSLTFRTVVGENTRTLQETDLSSFRSAFEAHLTSAGYQLRS